MQAAADSSDRGSSGFKVKRIPGLFTNQQTYPEVSYASNGKVVAFTTKKRLLSSDNNHKQDIYLKNLISGELTRVGGNGISGKPSLSADGNILVFTSSASNLGVADTNGANDIYVKNFQKNAISRFVCKLSYADCFGVVSGDGNTVFFPSRETSYRQLPEEKANLYTYNVTTKKLKQVKVTREIIANQGYPVDISTRGNVLLFEVEVDAPNSLGSNTRLYVKDLVTGEHRQLIKRISWPGIYSALSGDGRSVFFSWETISSINGSAKTSLQLWRSGTPVWGFKSKYPNQVAVSNDGRKVLFIRNGKMVHRNLDTKISHRSAPETFSLDGSGQKIAAIATAGNIVPGDQNGIWDLFIYTFD